MLPPRPLIFKFNYREGENIVFVEGVQLTSSSLYAVLVKIFIKIKRFNFFVNIFVLYCIVLKKLFTGTMLDKTMNY